MLNSRFSAPTQSKNRKLRSHDYKQVGGVFCAQFEFRTQTEVNKSQTQRIGDYKGFGVQKCTRLRAQIEKYLKSASYLTQTQNSKIMAAHVREERRRIRQLHNARPPLPRLFRDRTNPLEELPAEAVFDRFWFSPATIMFIMTIVGEAASQTTRNCPLPPLMKLLVCLRYLASGTFHINVGDSLGISRPVAGLAIRNMTKRIAALAGR